VGPIEGRRVAVLADPHHQRLGRQAAAHVAAHHEAQPAEHLALEHLVAALA
jgi:hypothetical protein